MTLIMCKEPFPHHHRADLTYEGERLPRLDIRLSQLGVAEL